MRSPPTRVGTSGGFKQEHDFAELPVPAAMQGSLAVAFAAQARGWTSHGSSIACWRQVRVFAKFVSGLECPPDDLDGLTAAMLKRWRAAQIDTNDGKKTLVTVRAFLLRDPRLATGAVVEELAKRIPMPSPSKKSFTQTELKRVLPAAQQQFRAARLRIQENTRLPEAWRADLLPGGSREGKLGEVLDHLARTRDVPRTRHPGGQTGVTHHRILGACNATSTCGADLAPVPRDSGRVNGNMHRPSRAGGRRAEDGPRPQRPGSRLHPAQRPRKRIHLS
ncbi:hypothetical protein ACFQ10_49840 [Streptomyces indonesiensis]